MPPHLVAPLVAYLAHEECPVSGEIYAAGAGRFARIFIASTPGYLQTETEPTIEDVAAHWSAINDETDYVVPAEPPRLVGGVHGTPVREAGGLLTMDLTLNESERELAELCRTFAQKEIATRAPVAWEEARCPTDLLREMGELGLLGILIPEEWGGIGMTTVGFVAAMEQIGLADQSVAAAWQAHLTIGSLPLLHVRQRRATRAVAAPAGGGPGARRLRADRARRGLRRTRHPHPRRAPRRRLAHQRVARRSSPTPGRTCPSASRCWPRADEKYATLVVEKDTPGFTMGPKMRGIGWKGLDTRELFFDDVWVPDDHLVGDPNLGLAQFLRTLEVGRISIAALSLSLTQAVLDLALDYAQERQQFGQPISKFQAVQFKLADIATELEAARWLTYRAASLRDNGQPFLKEAAMAKLKASRLATWAASEAVQIHGGLGYMLESPVARFYCDAKVLEIGEGTNEIQHLVIARALGC